MTYAVDPDELRTLATGLARVRAGVEELDRLGRGAGPELGSPAVARALHDAGRHWDRTRASLLGQLEALAVAARSCAQTYDAVETGLLRAAGRP